MAQSTKWKVVPGDLAQITFTLSDNAAALAAELTVRTMLDADSDVDYNELVATAGRTVVGSTVTMTIDGSITQDWGGRRLFWLLRDPAADLTLRSGELGFVRDQEGASGGGSVERSSGTPSGSGSAFHVQAVASQSWVIAHNLGFRPNVEVFDDADQQVVGRIWHLDDDTVEIVFLSALTGTAVLS